ncbi:BQ2448_440 [Microbotryum intermedium]|uniref:BQ2448_440 protein n=1 Tax=Microbotryum intermedium TaxID=269621 RepID=A0A238F6D1_9BASI|nr:BQ2448_440 [Microbotryum intermedium]
MVHAVAAATGSASGSVPWIDELRNALPNTPIHTRGDPLYQLSSSLFNAAINSPAKCAVLVADTQQIVTVVQFARRHGLSFSCKGGGFNVAGWAVQGNIILDLCRLDSIDVHTANPATGQFNIEPLSQLRAPASRESSLPKDDQLARKRKAAGAPGEPPNA